MHQKIWDEIGEADNERDKMLFELEQECLDAYRKKVDQASRSRAQLRQAVADAEAQLADISSVMGDRPVHVNKSSGSLKKELQAIMPLLEDMKKKRDERKAQFSEVLRQINCIAKELSGSIEDNFSATVNDEHDLSMKRLDDLRSQLTFLQKEKSERMKQVLDQLNVLNALCMVLGMEFKSTVCGVHPSLVDSSGQKSISTDTIKGLSATISRLKDVKLQRMQRLAMTMVELWNLMDTAVEDQQKFQNVTRTIAAAEHEIKEPNSLSMELIDNAEAEVSRLQEMKMSKIKEVILRKQEVLEEICRGAHMVVNAQFGTDHPVESIESGAITPSDILDQLEFQISEVKEEAFSRKEILEKVQKWLAAREEESWLEEYNRDDNRYNAGRGTHLMLKRAEKARVIINKIPAMLDTLKSKVKAWEQERKAEFLYDGVGLLSMINDYCELKHLKEQERQKQRDQKKLQGQLMTEQEAIYGSKPSPSKSSSKSFRPSTGGSAACKRFSLGGAVLQNSLSDKLAHPSRSLAKNKNNSIKRQPLHGHHLHSGLAAPHSSGKPVIPGRPIKHQSSYASNSKLTEPSTLRKALSPLSSICSNIITSCNNIDFPENTPQQMALNKPLTPPSSATTTPTKNVSIYDENRTPKTMPVPVPCTPPTASNAMQTAMTPFTPGRIGSAEVEYSYEEKRAGFVVPKSYYHRQLALV
ncbi:microtubule-associated protein 65-4 [Striga asiatica]|uniref:Microtubule-associated protein 65-4 n=1 Tax=Striga asiatica TaxID=4170 RepID=A0A5A7P0T2_STRAF|nr:microtubule-associated protein 65-4 [Striga asiatica]